MPVFVSFNLKDEIFQMKIIVSNRVVNRHAFSGAAERRGKKHPDKRFIVIRKQLKLMHMNYFLFTVLSLMAFSSTALYSQSEKMILVEAESFAEKGGWVVDPQFMDQMGSPYLLAHGLGTPVENAKATVTIPKTGRWHVYARTWNWCSPWVDEAPGAFRIVVNGTTLDNELGLGKQWDWEYAGQIEIKNKNNTVELHDLTGFEGRCDAILFTQEKNVPIPDRELSSFRKKLLGLPRKAPSAGTFDLVVVGAGSAGLCTAIKAAREGLKVALIHNRPVPGGNNSVEVRVVASGEIQVEPYPRLGDVVKEMGQIYRTSDKVKDMIIREKNLFYYPDMHVFSLEKEGDNIRSVTAKHIENGQERSFYAPLFADCTGDANVGYLAGAEYRVGREMRAETRETLAPDRPDNITLGTSLNWASEDTGEEVVFSVCNWAIRFTDESCEKVFSGSNWWETGFGYDQVHEAEFIRDYLFRAIYGNWSFLKNHSKYKGEYKNRKLNSLSYIAGKRESRRLMGDVLFKQQDAEGAYERYDDAIIYGSYSIDQHFPTPKNTFFFPGEEFITTMKHGFNDLGTPRRYLRDDQVNPPYRIPYRCLYSKNINNLFMAGRQISVSHIALASTRVQRTTGMMGEVVAVAAGICKKYACSPRAVYTRYLDELKNKFK